MSAELNASNASAPAAPAETLVGTSLDGQNNAGEQGTPAAEESEDAEEGEDSEEEEKEGSEKKDAKADKAEKKEEKKLEKQLKKLRIKYNGKEEDVEFDPNDEEFLRKQFQLAKLGTANAGKYSQLENEVKTFIENLRKDPAAALSDPSVGVDLKQLAKQVIEQEIENSKKSPEQLEKEKIEKELKKLKADYDKEKQERTEREKARLKGEALERYDTMVSNALSKSDLPKAPYVVSKFADYMLLGLEHGIEVTPDDLLPIIREEVLEDMRSMVHIMPDDVLETFLGKDRIKGIRKKAVAKVKAAPVNAAAIKDTGADKKAEQKQEPEKKQTAKSFFGF